MNLEKQVTSLELSKELKNLGINQESLFYWHNLDSIPSIICSHWYPERSGDFFVSAFTMAELLHLLPMHITIKGDEPFDNYRLQITSSVVVKNPEHIDPVRTTIVNYRCDAISMENKETILAGALGRYLSKNMWDENPADALAKMLIYLMENNFMDVHQ